MLWHNYASLDLARPRSVQSGGHAGPVVGTQIMQKAPSGGALEPLRASAARLFQFAQRQGQARALAAGGRFDHHPGLHGLIESGA